MFSHVSNVLSSILTTDDFLQHINAAVWRSQIHYFSTGDYMTMYTLIKLLPSYLITWCENLITRIDEVPCTNIGNMTQNPLLLHPPAIWSSTIIQLSTRTRDGKLSTTLLNLVKSIRNTIFPLIKSKNQSFTVNTYLLNNKFKSHFLNSAQNYK
jgi:hypothetical protein